MTRGDCRGEVLLWSVEVRSEESYSGSAVGVGSGLEVLRFCAFDTGRGSGEAKSTSIAGDSTVERSDLEE